MANTYSVADLVEFLDHAGDKGLMPAATAQALAVATRNVMGILTDQEKKDLGGQDLDAVIRRFNNKRAKDFNPSSLKEYGRRVRRAIDLFLRWRADPANFTVKTRATSGSRRKGNAAEIADTEETEVAAESVMSHRAGTYHSSIPVRPGMVVTVANVPHDLTKAEANRLADFIKMLAVEP
jgi:hypothetical protein